MWHFNRFHFETIRKCGKWTEEWFFFAKEKIWKISLLWDEYPADSRNGENDESEASEMSMCQNKFFFDRTHFVCVLQCSDLQARSETKN